MIKLTLDSNCFSTDEKDMQLYSKLADMQKEGKIELFTTEEVLQETNLIISKKKQNENLEKHSLKKLQKICDFYIDKIEVINHNLGTEILSSGLIRDKRIEIGIQVDKILSDKKQFMDSEIFVSHLLAENNIFVTNDNGFLNRKDALEQKFKTKIIPFNDSLAVYLKNFLIAGCISSA